MAFFTANEASKRETRRLTRDMGFNLRIIPKKTNMNNFWVKGYSDFYMPEEYVNRFWESENFSFAHLTATLYKKITWNGKEVILAGIAPEIKPLAKKFDKKKTDMGFTIDSGTVYIGYELAESMNLNRRDTIKILNKDFTIAKTLSETGSMDDIKIYGLLSEYQDLLNLNGKINEIMALDCLCLLTPDEQGSQLQWIRERLTRILPEANVIMNTKIAETRVKQRHMLEQYFADITIFVIILIALWIGVLVMINVRERITEIGVLNAIGHSWSKIAGLFLGKVLLIGLISAFIGFILGTGLALKYAPDIFKVTADAIKPIYGLLGWSLLFAPVFSALSALIPTMIAVSKDPAVILRKE
ncbi:hypothetical protein AKJ55_00510 [candidate division MSBL1 archaeon SCGC-AAA382M17]|uniref:ABC3 transporter permease C-terminal domain-containing protein n=1 Tax=candidate division MSBL1 archaeon SCGC-AAA382M17 TaxID=1698284 RepID=A0ABR5TJW4_9EURY|nr:hypothetical protein AKJ55_00510 [candidate division MSBL1 archaeon SCGC-AAA382M17]